MTPSELCLGPDSDSNLWLFFLLKGDSERNPVIPSSCYGFWQQQQLAWQINAQVPCYLLSDRICCDGLFECVVSIELPAETLGTIKETMAQQLPHIGTRRHPLGNIPICMWPCQNGFVSVVLSYSALFPDSCGQRQAGTKCDAYGTSKTWRSRFPPAIPICISC